MEFVLLYISNKRLIMAFLVLCLSSTNVLQSEAQVLPDNEVQTLQQIATKLKIREWDVNRTFCQRSNTIDASGTITNNVTCDCNNSICHVTSIKLKSLNLSGELPNEFAMLTFLREIDITRNFLHGSIPSSWASLPLVALSLTGNLIGGTIPREFGNIATLEKLFLQDNELVGPLPPELGKLGNLRTAVFTGNNFTGVLPDTLANLRNLTDFRIDGSTLSGKIPEFIGNWTQLARLDMQGTSMQGPIPSTISLLTKLKELRISDLNVLNMSFPNLQNMTILENLVLRNCSIVGQIPSYIGERMQYLMRLDLSFNRLTGTIPESLERLRFLQYMYLTNNSLTGEIEQWISDTNQYIDISYNNFTGATASPCQTTTLNRISSYPASMENSTAWCLIKDLPCSRTSSKYYNLFINCGGPRLVLEKKQYEEDTEKGSPSAFYSTEKWARSTTGGFMNDDEAKYVASKNGADQSIYSTARLAPLSLKYYGLCLIPGSYTVTLHFAEIMFVADQKNKIRGRRIFDVYIQGKRVLTNFNIAEEAGGVDKHIFKQYNAIVTESTLEIHLYWAGKGTVSLPDKGVYGPLISAISVTRNFDIDNGGLSDGAIAGIVVGSFVGFLFILAVVWIKCFRGPSGGRDLEDKELRGLQLQTLVTRLRSGSGSESARAPK